MRGARLATSIAAAGLSLFLLLSPSRAASPEHASLAAAGLNTEIAAVAAIRSARLAEPLIAVASTTPEEDIALAQAIAAYATRSVPDDMSSLTAFLDAHPHSGWGPAVQTNLGLSYLHYGYFSRALGAWRQAWNDGKEATDPGARALVDRAVGELAFLEASLGHMDDLAALFDEIGKRPITGSATEAVQNAREELTLVQKDPRHLFICGPVALQALLLATGSPREKVDFLQWYRAGPNGTNLAEVSRLADKANLSYRLVFRQSGQAVPVPSVVHWKVGHFAAIVEQSNGRYHVRDSVFPSDLWVTPAALDAEASGYFLIPTNIRADERWRNVEVEEAATIWGKGPTNQTQPGGVGSDPPADGASPSAGSDPSPADPNSTPPGDSPNPPPNPPCSTCPCGMCGYNIGESTVSVSLMDAPVGYSPPIGPSVMVRIRYNQREDSQPANFNFFNVSQKWTLNWIDYVTDDPTNPGANVSRYLSSGGSYQYAGYNSTTGQFAPQTTDGSVLSRVSQSPITYRRQLRDGSVAVYSQTDGSASYPRHVFLTQFIDPQGNAVTLTYDGQLRLTTLTDATGRQTTFTYGFAARPLLVTRITDPFGRSASLTYDSSARLSSITDVLGLTSSFTYDNNSLVNALTTPYGATTFAYTAPGASGPPRFVDVTDPLGYHEREEWLEPAPIPDSDPAALDQSILVLSRQFPLGQKRLCRGRMYAVRRM